MKYETCRMIMQTCDNIINNRKTNLIERVNHLKRFATSSNIDIYEHGGVSREVHDGGFVDGSEYNEHKYSIEVLNKYRILFDNFCNCANYDESEYQLYVQTPEVQQAIKEKRFYIPKGYGWKYPKINKYPSDYDWRTQKNNFVKDVMFGLELADDD